MRCQIISDCVTNEGIPLEIARFLPIPDGQMVAITQAGVGVIGEDHEEEPVAEQEAAAGSKGKSRSR